MNIAKVAAISANNNAGVGEILADAMDKVGRKASSRSRKAKGWKTELTVVEGMQFDKGLYLALFY